MTTERPTPLRLLRLAIVFVVLGGLWWIYYGSLTEAAESDADGGVEPVGTELGVDDLPQRIRHPATGAVLVLIPPGDFTMGTPESERRRDGDEAQRDMEIDAPFYLGETEVTVGQWKAIMGSELAGDQADDLPIGGVSWHLAQEFIAALNETGDGGWRLPTEAEWEYACRAGTTTPFWFGDNISPLQANFRGDRPYVDAEPGLSREAPVPVRSLPANPWGLYEVHGNLWEWCEDRYAVDPERDWPGQERGGPRVMRGGAFTSLGEQLRSGYRDGYPPNSSGEKYGFRLARSVVR